MQYFGLAYIHVQLLTSLTMHSLWSSNTYKCTCTWIFCQPDRGDPISSLTSLVWKSNTHQQGVSCHNYTLDCRTNIHTCTWIHIHVHVSLRMHMQRRPIEKRTFSREVWYIPSWDNYTSISYLITCLRVSYVYCVGQLISDFTIGSTISTQYGGDYASSHIHVHL